MDKKDKPKSTTEIMDDAIGDIDSLEEFIRKYEGNFVAKNLPEYIIQIMITKNLDKPQIIADSGLDRTYSYQIFNGRRHPTREKLIQLSFGLKLSIDECDRMFKIAGYSPLYSRVREDAAALYCIKKGYKYIDYTIFLDNL